MTDRENSRVEENATEEIVAQEALAQNEQKEDVTSSNEEVTTEETPIEETAEEPSVEEGTTEETPEEEDASGKKKESFIQGLAINLSIFSVIMIAALVAIILITGKVTASEATDETEPSSSESDTFVDPEGTVSPTNPEQPTDPEQPTERPTDPEQPTERPTDPEQPTEPEVVISEFKNSVANIGNQLTDNEDINSNADIFVENIGEDKLKELVAEYDELAVQKAIAQFLVFVPEIKMQQYVANNGLYYNPNAAEDYEQMLLEADEAYRAATGKNPDGALMSLEGYDIYKSNREAIKVLIADTGDTALYEWYTAKTEGYDLMMKQIRDTQAAEEYKEEVKLEIVNSQGSVKLFKLQLEKEVNGEITVMDNVSMQYTDSYKMFILNNYMYVIAN